jgi:nitrate/nitrite-specific signal transduction histidine kinase
MNHEETTAQSDLLPCDPLGAMAHAGGSREALATLRRAQELVRDAQAAIEEASRVVGQGDAGGNASDMEARLAAVESERQELSCRLSEVEHQVGRMMTLYVATYQLHSTLDPVEVQSTIAEIALNLIGAEQFVLILRDDEDRGYQVRLNQGDANVRWARSPRYEGGDPLVDSALTDGGIRFGPHPDSPVLAVVPLRVQDVSIGALAIFKLLSHKPALVKEDHDLLDLLGAHAASAIFASRTYTKTARKLRTLEGLIKLVNQG